MTPAILVIEHGAPSIRRGSMKSEPEETRRRRRGLRGRVFLASDALRGDD